MRHLLDGTIRRGVRIPSGQQPGQGLQRDVGKCVSAASTVKFNFIVHRREIFNLLLASCLKVIDGENNS